MKGFQEKAKIIAGQEADRILYRLSQQVLENHSDPRKLVLIGIQTRGVYLSRRIKEIIRDKENIEVPLGILDITLYRDDLTGVEEVPLVKETKINFDITKKILVLVDDVLFTGRTVRCALDEIMDFGRPEKVELLVLVDRGHRELPIKADYVGKNIPTSRREQVEVRIKEVDGVDEVVVLERKPV